MSDKRLSAPAGVPQKESKHIVIMGVTDKVFRQIGELEDLIANISSRPNKEQEETPEMQPAPSLSDFLNSEAERLGMAVSRIGEAVGELRNLLF